MDKSIFTIRRKNYPASVRVSTFVNDDLDRQDYKKSLHNRLFIVTRIGFEPMTLSLEG